MESHGGKVASGGYLGLGWPWAGGIAVVAAKGYHPAVIIRGVFSATQQQSVFGVVDVDLEVAEESSSQDEINGSHARTELLAQPQEQRALIRDDGELHGALEHRNAGAIVIEIIRGHSARHRLKLPPPPRELPAGPEVNRFAGYQREAINNSGGHRLLAVGHVKCSTRPLHQIGEGRLEALESRK